MLPTSLRNQWWQARSTLQSTGRSRAPHKALQPEADWALQSLTALEQNVLNAVMQGASHRQVSELPGLNPRTAEMPKARGAGTLDAERLAELFNMVIRSNDPPKVGLA
jgi:FixJ family two-component response regulator